MAFSHLPGLLVLGFIILQVQERVLTYLCSLYLKILMSVLILRHVGLTVLFSLLLLFIYFLCTVTVCDTVHSCVSTHCSYYCSHHVDRFDISFSFTSLLVSFHCMLIFFNVNYVCHALSQFCISYCILICCYHHLKFVSTKGSKFPSTFGFIIEVKNL